MKPNAPPPRLVMARLLPDGADPEEALGHFEHQLRNRLGLAHVARLRSVPTSFSIDTCVVNKDNDTLVVINTPDTAGVIARPPLFFLAALLLGIAADRLLPVPSTLRWTDAAAGSSPASLS